MYHVKELETAVSLKNKLRDFWPENRDIVRVIMVRPGIRLTEIRKQVYSELCFLNKQ